MASSGDQLSLWARELVAASRNDWPQEGGQLDVSFLHRGFCIMGMPLRQPKDSLRPFSRHDGRFALTIEPASVTHPDGGLINIGVPFGPKARLIAMWMATEVQNPRRNTTDRILELNGITDWLEALGIPARGGATGSIAATKDQFMRLAFSTFTMVLRGPNSEELFKRECSSIRDFQWILTRHVYKCKIIIRGFYVFNYRLALSFYLRPIMEFSEI